jgi:antitoxin component YwqK of YwqJK toxin-antitoxin module
MKYVKYAKELRFIFLMALVLFSLTSAKKSTSHARSKAPRPLELTSVHIVDRNGFAETFSNKDRLKQFQNIDFSTPQSYRKVLRIYQRDSRGDVRSAVNTYYDNSNPRQFLEILNGRAQGSYVEWHENGVMHLKTHVINGTPDVTPVAERTWVFDGSSVVWDENGHLLAEIYYAQGALENTSIYYHPSGKIWKRIPYAKNQIDGVVEIYKNNGELLQRSQYCQGKQEGESLRYWDQKCLASQEQYYQDRLENGQYFDKEGSLVAEVRQGTGYKALFGKSHLSELQEYREGFLEGEVKVFANEARLKRVYHVKNDKKHGEEIEYFDQSIYSTDQLPQPHLLFNWYEGKIQGAVKTWYANGNIESQKEMANNAKNGVLTAWYRDGNIMLIEEYDNDKLVRGDYFRKCEKTPISQVINGKGVVTIFDAEGHFVQKISYANGKPDV